jgi:citrate synthase
MAGFITIPVPFLGHLDERKSRLLGLTVIAHQQACTNNQNASKEICKCVAKCGGRIEGGIASAILSLGGTHAPLADAREMYLRGNHFLISKKLSENSNYKVPGFGNSFFRDSVDPAWIPVDSFLKESFPLSRDKITQLKNDVELATGKRLFPNAALFTAAVCEICEIPIGMESSIFILSRLPIWMDYASR